MYEDTELNRLMTETLRSPKIMAKIACNEAG